MPLQADYPFVLPLDAEVATLESAGGKGTSLASMAAAGLPILPGFHVTTSAYHRFVESNGLQEAIMAAVAQASEDPASLDQAAGVIHGLFGRSIMPDDVAAAIRTAYTGLGEGKPAVAVRSSATAEDLPELSFAGQQETYLNVRGLEALVAAVQRCWGSVWTARAIGYRSRMGIGQQNVAMGVVVQRMVPAEISGVTFTANPMTGDRTELVVNASFGLGEAVVSGQVTPDTYVVDRDRLTAKDVTIGGKEIMVVPDAAQGTLTHPTGPGQRTERALSDARLRDLAELGLRIEQHFGGVPQDVEWAVAEDHCWILQARPITRLPPAPLRDVRWEPPEPGTSWIRRQVVENMPEPLSPLFDELYLSEGLDHSAEVIYAVMGVPPEIESMVDRPLFATVNGYAYMRASLNLRWKMAPVLLRTMISGIRWLLGGKGVVYWRDDALPAYLATIRRWKALDPALVSDEQLLYGVRELARADAVYWFAVSMAVGTAKVTDALLGGFLAVAAPRRGLTSGLYLRGFSSKILDSQSELETIAGQIRASEPLRALISAMPGKHLLDVLDRAGERDVLNALHGYFDRYGHQIYTLDFAEPTQADDPLPVLVGLKALVERPPDDAHSRLAELVRERDRQIVDTAESFDPLRRGLFHVLLRLAQRFGPYREEALFYIGAAWPTLRGLALELGRRFTAAGSLEVPDDMFYLHYEELEEAGAARKMGRARPDLARLARERRDLREARKRLHPPPAVPPSYRFKLGPFDLSNRETQRRNAAEDMTLRGFAVSPGRITAPASVIRSPADFADMEPGSILVCPTTTPAWTPLFAQARGLVTDIGGILAHGSIVAREYGIPAVMGTGNATQRIRSGQQISIDGNEGTVTLTGAISNGNSHIMRDKQDE